ncbi:hypothetical protein Tco_1227170 [Tanacetum coccineum]
MHENKSFNRNPTNRALYHALMEALIKDENVMDKGVADTVKDHKRWHDDDEDNDDEGPSAGPNQKELVEKPSVEVDMDVQSTLRVTMWPPTPDLEWNKHQVVLDQPEQPWFKQMVSATKEHVTFNDLMATPIDFSKLDWNNLEGDRYPFDLSKPLPLQGRPGRLTVDDDYFFNNDMEYLKTSHLENTYTTSITKTKAARYEIKGIEDIVPTLWSSTKVGYEKDALKGIKHWGDRHKLWYRSQIVVKRADRQFYKFKEGDFLDLHLNDIKDMLLLAVQHKLFHLNDSDIVDFIVALLMLVDELYKFSDGTLKMVRDELHYRLLNFRLGYNKEMSSRKWTDIDQKRSGLMIELIDKQIRERRIIQNLERLVGAWKLEMDYKLMTFKHAQSEEVQELLSKLVQDLQSINEELAEYINTLNWNHIIIYYDDDDDEDYTIAITLVLSTEEPIDSLIMEDEHLDTIPATESDGNSSGSTTTRSDYSLPGYEAFYFNDVRIEEKSSGSTTTHSDISLSKYDSFIFDLSINRCPPADRSDCYHEEFTDELAHIISPPEYDHFYFKIEPELGNLTMDVVGDIFDKPIREPRVHVPNILPTHPTLHLDLDYILYSDSLFAYVVWIFLPFHMYPVSPPYLLSTGNEDTIFDPDIPIYHSFMSGISHRSGTFMKFNVYPNNLNESPMEILSSTCSPMY